MATLQVGDFVRVSAARRRDLTWRVTEIAGQIVVAINDGGGEIHYDAERLELVELPENALPAAATTQPSPQPYGTRWSAGNIPSEIRDSTVVKPGPGESIDSICKRFKKAVDRSGVLHELREHGHFVSPGQRRRMKSFRARQRRANEDAALLAASRNF